MNCHRHRALLLTLLVAFWTGTPALAGTLYVDASLATGANNGSSWADAFQGTSGVRLALAAAVSGDEIWVAKGTYLPTQSGVRTRSFDMKSNVALYGGFVSGATNLFQRDPALHVTILSGDLAGDDGLGNYGDNSYHVVVGRSLGATTILDGFHIQGGNANGSTSFPVYDNSGGGLLQFDTYLTVRRCVFSGNRCASSGGAAFVLPNGGAPTMRDCRFVDNHAGVSGGAVFVGGTDASFFWRCLFTGNSAPAGSAVYLSVAFDGFFRDCLLFGNSATGAGATLEEAAESYFWLINTTVAANTGGGVRSNHEAWIWNSIIYFNTGAGVAVGQPVASHSCVQGGLPGTAMVNADPLFVDVAGGNFRLSSASPCIDRGDNDFSKSALDLDFTPRFEDVTNVTDLGLGIGPIVDLGAYESPGGLFDWFCASGSSMAANCPCGNEGQTGRGCRHSAWNSVGGLLSASGTANPDTVQLTASELRGGVLCIFLQGNVAISGGVAFGDGVRCVGGALKRIGSKSAASNGIALHPGPGDPTISARSAAVGDPISPGTQRWYQTWYRDNASSFCSPPQGGTSNVSSGVIVSW